jgi:hypothetical protein
VSSFISSRKVTARKDYFCEFCKKEIQKGAKHDYHFCVIDGDSSSYRTHDKCTQILSVEATEDNDSFMPISLAFDCARDRFLDSQSSGYIPELESFYGLSIVEIITSLDDVKNHQGLVSGGNQ